MNELSDELKDVLGMGEPESEPEPSPEPEPAQEPELDADPEPEPESEPAPEPDPEPEAEPEPEPEPEPTPEPESEPEPEDKDEVVSLREQNKLLLERVEALEGGASKKPEPEAEPAAEAEPEPEKILNFLADEDDVDGLLGSKEKLEAFAQRIYKKAVEDAGGSTRESILRVIPNMMVEQVQKQLVLREAIMDYFKANEDLAVAKRTFGGLMNEVVGEHPDWKIKEVLEEAGNKTRTVLGIKKQAVHLLDDGGGDKGKGRSPAFVDGNKGGRKQSSDRRSGLQREIDDVLID